MSPFQQLRSRFLLQVSLWGRSRIRLNRLGSKSMALILVVASISSVCSTAYGQQGAPRGFWANKLWIDEIQKKSNEEKREMINQATEFIKLSGPQIEQLSSRLSKLEGDLEFAKSQVSICEKEIDSSESQLRISRQKRTERMDNLLAKQEEKSPYRLALKRLRDAQEDCAQQSERLLKRPVIDGSPDKLRSSLKKSEFQKLEDDKDCVNAFRQYNKAKEEKLEQEKQLVAGDREISKLDETIRVLNETLRKQKNELTTAKGRLASIKKSTHAVSVNLADFKAGQENAQIFLAGKTGK